jgi:hypothetical protein
MVDNQHNYFGAAPDKGILNGPVTVAANVSEILITTPELHNGTLSARDNSDDFWLSSIPHGKASTSDSPPPKEKLLTYHRCPTPIVHTNSIAT